MKDFKKIILVFVLCVLAIGLAGCGKDKKNNTVNPTPTPTPEPAPTNRTLSCSKDIEGSQVSMDIAFSSNTVTGIDVAMQMSLSEYSDSDIEQIKKQDLCVYLKTAFNDGITNCTQDITGKTLYLKGTADVNKLTEEDLDASKGFDEVKSALVQEGYNCVEK